MSLARIGKPPDKLYNINKITKRLPHKKHTEETKNKIRLTKFGKKASEETKLKMSKSHMKKDII